MLVSTTNINRHVALACLLAAGATGGGEAYGRLAPPPPPERRASMSVVELLAQLRWRTLRPPYWALAEDAYAVESPDGFRLAQVGWRYELRSPAGEVLATGSSVKDLFLLAKDVIRKESAT